MLSAGFLPLNLLIYVSAAYGGARGGKGDGGGGAHAHLEWSGLFLTIGIVIAGIAAGLALSKRAGSARARARANAAGQLAGLSLITLSVVLARLGASCGEGWGGKGATFYVAVAFPCVCGLMLASALSSLPALRIPELARGRLVITETHRHSQPSAGSSARNSVSVTWCSDGGT